MQTNLFSSTPGDIDINFPTSYQQIIERIHQVDPVQYSRTRNFFNGAVTYLSPYISRGVISVKQVKEIVLAKGYKPYLIEKFLQELAWREYYQRTWQHFGEDIWKDIKQTQPDVVHHQMPEAIVKAATGIEAIDKSIHHFYATGYLHNHVRMYIASIVCNMSKAHWKQPSQWMYYHLLDGDMASNNCSWQWVSAAFSSKKYYFNQDNLNKYTFSKQQQTFLDKSYEDIMCMEIPLMLQSTTDLDLQTTLPVTEKPLIDISKPTLIYNSYNLDGQWRKGEDVNRVLLLEPSHFSKYPVSEKVIQFLIDLSEDIEGVQIYTGEIGAITDLYKETPLNNTCIISKEHPAFTHYGGIKDQRDWMYEKVSGYHSSFFSYWKKCERYI